MKTALPVFLPDYNLPYREFIKQMEILYLARMLNRCDGNITMLSQKSGLARSVVYYKLKQYGLYTSAPPANEKGGKFMRGDPSLN